MQSQAATESEKRYVDRLNTRMQLLSFAATVSDPKVFSLLDSKEYESLNDFISAVSQTDMPQQFKNRMLVNDVLMNAVSALTKASEGYSMALMSARDKDGNIDIKRIKQAEEIYGPIFSSYITDILDTYKAATGFELMPGLNSGLKKEEPTTEPPNQGFNLMYPGSFRSLQKSGPPLTNQFFNLNSPGYKKKR